MRRTLISLLHSRNAIDVAPQHHVRQNAQAFQAFNLKCLALSITDGVNAGLSLPAHREIVTK